MGGSGGGNPVKSAIDTVGGGAGQVAGGLVGGVSSLGGGVGDFFSGLNPFRKPDVPTAPDVVSPKAIKAPAQLTGKAPTVQAPGSFTGATINPTNINMGADDFRLAQLDTIKTLAGQATGQGPSIVQNQLNQARDANVAAALGAANSARGGANPGMMRTAMQQAADANIQASTEGATARLQEQLQAAGILGQIAGQGRSGDIQLATQEAQNDLQAAIAQGGIDQDTAKTIYNAAAQKGITDAQLSMAFKQLQAQYASMGLDAAKANQNAALQVQSLIQSGTLGNAGIITQQDASQKGMIGGLMQGAGSGAMAYAMMSDENVKTDIKPGDSKIIGFLDALDAHDYKYKDEKHGEGRFVSVMAQELEKSEIGRSMVVETDDGKMVDYGKGFGALLAAQAVLNKRLKKLEDK